jgi:hypothetical protein
MLGSSLLHNISGTHIMWMSCGLMCHAGKMAILWTGQSHTTYNLTDLPRDYALVEVCMWVRSLTVLILCWTDIVSAGSRLLE